LLKYTFSCQEHIFRKTYSFIRFSIALAKKMFLYIELFFYGKNDFVEEFKILLDTENNFVKPAK